MSADKTGQRHVGGVWCGDVLALLPDFVDGSLTPEQARAAQEHLAGCDWCERFGAEYSGVVRALRARFEVDLDADVAERLRGRLAQLDPA